MENPNSLVIWEAQFGGFANRAHVIFDLLCYFLMVMMIKALNIQVQDWNASFRQTKLLNNYPTSKHTPTSDLTKATQLHQPKAQTTVTDPAQSRQTYKDKAQANTHRFS
ncbi:unnamed protein product [Lupinus luteus]|uniref:Uncharacterized protein n=1 Tax=Lupinus luteus TaxID=3873 RepID=A0AAV1X6M1_LUPLU